jgi:D-arginine dehydrogenase
MAPDIVIIGGGVAGLSAAAALADQARVAVLEAEEQVGFHSSGRSATMVHYALGDRVVRALTSASRNFFEAPPDDFSDAPLGQRMPVLVHARTNELTALDALQAAIAGFAELERVGEKEMAELCPILRLGEGGAVAGLADHNGIRLDTHALLQSYLRRLRSRGGSLVAGARTAAIMREHGSWTVETERGERYSAPILVNAAGAWADSVATMAGVRPVGLRPLRRTIITFDAPRGYDVSRLPFTKTVGDELYFAPESGRLFASPMDEVPTDPCDAQPEDYDVALAAWRMEERTTIKVERIHSRWAGLRTFAPDRRPVAGFAADAQDFFWLAGQGGFGLQTSPAMAQIAAVLIAGKEWPVGSVNPDELSPARFLE